MDRVLRRELERVSEFLRRKRNIILLFLTFTILILWILPENNKFPEACHVECRHCDFNKCWVKCECLSCFNCLSIQGYRIGNI